MRKLWKVLPLLAFALTIMPAGRAMSAHSELAAQDPEVKVADGELVKVDLENQTLTIKMEDGAEMQFQYNSDTAVEGRENGVQGLTSDSGTHLTVHYTEDSGKRIATKITIKKSDS